MRHDTGLIMVAVMVAAAAGCGGSSDSEGDATSDTGGDTAIDTVEDSTPDTSPDTAVDPDPDGSDATDAPVDPGEDGDEPFVQDPVTFIVRNDSSVPAYFDWTFAGVDTVTGEYEVSTGTWETVDYWDPPCMVDCSLHDPGSMGCCIACLPPPSIKELAPGEEIVLEWTGEHTHVVDDAHCSCPCWWRESVAPGGYRAVACAFEAFTCWSEPCVPDASGVYEGANGEGISQCFTTDFSIPYAEDEVVVSITF